MSNKICIIGAGATGASLLWLLSQDPKQSWDVTLIHDQDTVGGHSLTKQVPWNGQTFPIDVGVQFISPMLYPNVHTQLQRPEFKSRVSVTDYDSLKIACAFPRNTQNQPVNWGNFPEYQAGPSFALYDADMKADANTFQNFLEFALVEGWGEKTLKDYFDNPPQNYINKDKFVTFFLAPYLSIINGYGAALMDQTLIVEVIPLFANFVIEKSPLGSFTQPGKGWQRFTNGTQSWVQAMVDIAKSSMAGIKVLLNTRATSVWTDQSTGKVTVVYKTNPTAVISSQTFDKVILTTDMWTNSTLLNNPQNQYFWNNLYKNYVGYGRDINNNPLGNPVVWDLMWGQCYIHTDSKLLSPDLQLQQETLQFNSYYASTGGGNYDLAKTFTTYLQKNLLAGPKADGLYLTMYGYIPDPAVDIVPDLAKVIFTTPWTHGKWSPAFMGDAKKNLHIAQGLGNISYSGQMNTNVYFAGNNATTDSEEGALDAAIAIADYAFGISYPFNVIEHPLAFGMYEIYKNLMFPAPTASHSIASKLLMMNKSSGKKAIKKKVTKKAKPAVKKKVSKSKPNSKKKSEAKKSVKTNNSKAKSVKKKKLNKKK